MSLQTFKEKLDNLKGEYTFNFANEDDCACLFEEFGGEERMKNKFPTVYQSYLNAREAALEQRKLSASDMQGQSAAAEKSIDINIGEMSLHYLTSSNVKKATDTSAAKGVDTDSDAEANEPMVELTIPITFTLLDTTKEVNSTEPADPWKGISTQIQLKDTFASKYLVNTSKVISSGNHYVSMIKTGAKKLSDLNNKIFNATVLVKGSDPEKRLNVKAAERTQEIGSSEYYTISNIQIDDPAPKNTAHWESKEIVMLYGRTGHNNADYVNGEYYDNAFNDGKVHLLIPIKGEVRFNDKVEPIKLTKPEGGESLSRSEATYDYKSQFFTYRSDITNDMELYNKIQTCFTKSAYSPNIKSTVKFDIAIPETGRSKYDWHTDVAGLQDGEPKTIMLTGYFTYDSKNQLGDTVQDQICIESITKSELQSIGGEYYKYVEGTNKIWIPPITIYWGCFGKDVKLLLADKTEKAAAHIQPGDALLSHDNRVLTVAEVATGHDSEIFQIKTKNGGEISVSGGHPMMCEGQSVRANKIKLGDKLNLADGSLTEVVSNEVVAYDDTVYNFVFIDEEKGNYIVSNGFLTGDLKMQNTKEETPEPILTDDDKLLIAEMMMHNEEII